MGVHALLICNVIRTLDLIIVIVGCNTYLFFCPLPAHCILGLELLERFAGRRHYHYAGPCRHRHAPAEHNERQHYPDSSFTHSHGFVTPIVK